MAVGNTTAVNALTQGDQLFVFGEAGFSGLRTHPSGDVLHVVFRQSRDHATHDGVGTLARLELLELLDDVVRVLLSQLGVSRRTGVAIGTVAGGANCGVAGFAFGQVSIIKSDVRIWEASLELTSSSPSIWNYTNKNLREILRIVTYIDISEYQLRNFELTNAS